MADDPKEAEAWKRLGLCILMTACRRRGRWNRDVDADWLASSRPRLNQGFQFHFLHDAPHHTRFDVYAEECSEKERKEGKEE